MLGHDFSVSNRLALDFEPGIDLSKSSDRQSFVAKLSLKQLGSLFEGVLSPFEQS